ncbi:metalloprotease [Alishewanella tabrizica]|uniref:Peptidase M50 domain-containing protein n=1 Tax=Alishewanella tabrizica TaxID=671278 RepID=A0ABQ2WFC4_9ALTE|nr:site-2 protease family protein [Alishewanella tabrizica]GGW53388.1 hypothetical protein GCM10008111_07020 [Alishewanella tabrizica]
MQTLFEFYHDQVFYQLKANNLGKEMLFRNGELVSQGRAFFSTSNDHRFFCPKHGPLRLYFKVSLKNADVSYRLEAGNTLLCEGITAAKPPKWLSKLEQKLSPEAESAQTASPAQQDTEMLHQPPLTQQTSDTATSAPSLLKQWFKPLLVLGVIALKLSKSAGAIKAALAGTALAGWAWLFNLEVAIGLIAAILIHEYGHVYAMKRAGLKVKGVYLLPFIGGAAVSERATSRWQDFKIAIAGPAFGTVGAIIAYLLWLETQHSTLALFAAISLLLNLFNLLPMVPLDGGRIMQAAAFSRKGKAAKTALLLVTGSLTLAAWYFGFYLLMLFGILGTFDLLSDREEHEKDIVPMTDTGILVTLFSYVGLMAILLWLSVIMADSGIPGTNLPLIFISS